MKEAWQVVGVHTADFNTAQASQAEKRPQNSRDPLRAYRQRRGLTSATWTPGLARDRAQGPCSGILAPRPGPAPSVLVWPLLTPAQGPDGTDSTPAPARAPPRVGLLHEGGGVLIKGCVYCARTPPLWSTPEPCPVALDPRAVHARHHPNDPTSSPPAGRVTTIRPDPPIAPVS